MSRKQLKPSGIAPPFGRYAHGLSVDLDNCEMVVTSGQLGMDPDGTIPDDVSEQADICFANVSAILAEAGGAPKHVVRINAFVTDRADFPAYMAARAPVRGLRQSRKKSSIGSTSGSTA